MYKRFIIFISLLIFSITSIAKSPEGDSSYFLLETNNIEDIAQKKHQIPSQHSPLKLDDHDEISQSAKSVYTLNNSEYTISDTSYTSTSSDESIIKVINSGILTIKSNVVLRKTSGASTNTNNSDYYGINSGILITKDSTLNIENINLIIKAIGSNGVFATGTNAKIQIENGEIETHRKSSKGLMSTYYGIINAMNISIETEGDSSAALGTEKNEGTIQCINCTLKTYGIDSPIIYSKGSITLEDSYGYSQESNLILIDSSINTEATTIIKNSKLYSNGQGNEGKIENCGIMIYQSNTKNEENKGIFICENSELSILTTSSYYDSVPFFFITNTEAQLNITGCTFNYGSNILLSLNSSSIYGTSGENGGIVELFINDQIIEGDIIVDSISELNLHLINSTYIGTINKYKEGNKIIINLDIKSTLNLTGDSYVNEIYNDDQSESNIIGNGKLIIIENDSDSDVGNWKSAIVVIVIIMAVLILGLFFAYFRKSHKKEKLVEGDDTKKNEIKNENDKE